MLCIFFFLTKEHSSHFENLAYDVGDIGSIVHDYGTLVLSLAQGKSCCLLSCRKLIEGIWIPVVQQKCFDFCKFWCFTSSAFLSAILQSNLTEDLVYNFPEAGPLLLVADLEENPEYLARRILYEYVGSDLNITEESAEAFIQVSKGKIVNDTCFTAGRTCLPLEGLALLLQVVMSIVVGKFLLVLKRALLWCKKQASSAAGAYFLLKACSFCRRDVHF